MRLRFTPTARQQFLDAIRFIALDKPSAARRYRKRAQKALERLREFPGSGHAIPEFPDVPHLQIVIGSHRYFYRVEKRTVWIVAVWHGRQQPPDPGAA